jgi:hypothetical protein
MDPTGPVAQRFPLVARSRPACTPLDVRVARLCTLAEAAERDADLTTASAVHNQAALLASDIGMPDLARRWCHQHATAYLAARPLAAQAARQAIEPLVNVARLHIRDGNGDAAFQLLDTLFCAISTRTDVVVDGIDVPAADLAMSAADHAELRRWLWTVHLADGTRALTSAGRWQDAHEHLRRRNGIGRLMLDGRQVAVIASITAGDTHAAQALLDATSAGEPWQDVVTACLTVLCRRDTGQPTDQPITQMLQRQGRLSPVPNLSVFTTRLGLSVIDAAGGADHPGARAIAATLIHHALTFADGYAARDLLAHEGNPALLADVQRRDLLQVVEASGLGRNGIPAQLSADLAAALTRSEAVIAGALTGRQDSAARSTPPFSSNRTLDPAGATNEV